MAVTNGQTGPGGPNEKNYRVLPANQPGVHYPGQQVGGTPASDWWMGPRPGEPGYTNYNGSGSGGGGTGAPVAPNTSGAAGLAYARAKDKIGAQTRASLMALRDEASTGGQFVAGGTNPALQSANASLLSRGEGRLADFATRQAQGEAAAANANEQQRYQAELQNWLRTQGQHASTQQSLLSLLGPRLLSPDGVNSTGYTQLQRVLAGMGLSLPGLY